MNKENKLTFFEIAVMFIVVGVTPFLVYLLKYEYQFVGERNSREFYDYFNLIKSNVILYTSAFILINSIMNFLVSERKYGERFNLKNILTHRNICISLVILSVIVSYIFSDYKDVALSGAYERFESIWMHFSYMIIFIYFTKLTKKDNWFQFFSYAILLSSFVVGLIGTLQYFDINVIMMEFFQKITTGGRTGLTSNSIGSYTTLYNINTSASYSLLVIYMLILVFTINKNKVIKTITLIDLALIFTTFLNSFSEASYIAFIVSILFMLCLYALKFYKENNQKYSNLLIGAIFTIVFIPILLFATNDSFKNKVLNVIGEPDIFTDWYQDENDFYFYNKDDEFIKVELLENSYNVYENDRLLSSIEYLNNEDVIIKTENFESINLKYAFTTEDEDFLNFNDLVNIRLDEPYAVVGRGSLRKAEHIDFVGFEGYSNIFSFRGYIWSRSNQLLLDRFFIGYGSDAFFHVFPNDDIVGRAFSSFPNVLVDKPHSIYLNMAINNGIFYLVGFIGLVFLAFREKFELLLKSFTDKKVNSLPIILYLTGIVAYLINGISTDNITIIIVFFWIYLAFDSDIFLEKD